MADKMDVFVFLRDKLDTEPKKLFNVHEIMEAVNVAPEYILSVKNTLEGGIDNGDYERKIAKGKAWYRLRYIDVGVRE